MRNSLAAKTLHYTLLTAAALTAAFLAAITTANPAAARSDGDENARQTFAWDTDNLRYGNFSARNFRVPFHQYGGYLDRTPALPCIQYFNPNSASGTSRLSASSYDGTCPAGSELATAWCRYERIRDNAVRYEKVENRTSLGCPLLSGYYRGTPYSSLPSGWHFCRSGRYYVAADCGGGVGGQESGGSRVYATRLSHPGCQRAVADAFFQAGGNSGTSHDFPVDDFPVIEHTESGWRTGDGTGERGEGCADFVKQQDRLASSMSANGGWYLTAEGVLKKNSGEIPASSISRPAAAYGTWAGKGSAYYHLGRHNGYRRTAGGDYLASTSSLYDNRADPANGQLAVATGLPATGLFPWGTSSPTGSGQTVPCAGAGVQGCYDRSSFAVRTNRLLGAHNSQFAVAASANLKRYANQSWNAYLNRIVVSSTALNSRLVHLSHAQDAGGGWCPAGWHPRGQDSLFAIGPSTGRTLTSLDSERLSKLADSYWCRSDVRYTLKFNAEQHDCGTVPYRGPCSSPTGVTLPAAGSDFGSYGRKNCYKTMTGYDIAAAECEYAFPLPRCDSDGDGTADREFSAAEIANIGVEDEPLAVGEAADCGTNINPPDLAGFDADPCVTVRLSVSENLPAASDASPGVSAGDRTVSGIAGHDLGSSAAFPNTAAPPRDLTAGSEDPSGCPDGEEERADHGVRASPSDTVLPAASPQRRGSQASADPASPHSVPAPLPSSSSAANTAAPPSDYDADNSYAGVRANLAHRYASKIAENTCAAKRAEADLVMAVLQARRASFSEYLADYKDAADDNETKFAGYTAVNSGASGLSWYWARDTAAELNRAAAALSTAYGNLSTALVDAKTAYDNATNQTQNLPETTADDRAQVIAATSSLGCVKHYDDETARLKKIFADAETAALDTGANGIAEEATAIATHQPKTWDRPSVRLRPYSIREYGGSPRHRTTTATEQYDCTGQGDDRSCETRTVTACSGYRYTRSGRIDGSYTPKSRSLNARGILVETSRRAETRSRTFSGTDTAAAGSYRSTDTVQGCPAGSFRGETQAQAENDMRGSVGTVLTTPPWPSLDSPVAATAIYTSATPAAFLLPPSQMLGKYHPDHTDRADLDHSDQLERATAATRLGALSVSSADGRNPAAYAAVAVPAANPQNLTNADTLRTAVQTAATSYRQTYTAAYDRAHTRARSDMGGTGGTQQQARWSNFRWEYDRNSLEWENYTQNVTTDTTLADGTVIQGQAGCDLVSVDTDGKVTVAATRLDFESSSYGVGRAFATRPQPEQRECKVRRTRTPRLELAYEPPTTATERPWRACPAVMTDSTLPCGTDSHSSRTGDYYDTDFQPNSSAEKFKIYPRKPATEPGEAEILNLRVSLSDSPPVLCHSTYSQPITISNKAAATADAMSRAGSVWRSAAVSATSVIRPVPWSGTVTADHCFAAPTSGQGWAVFDDTAHSAMVGASIAHVSGVGGIIAVSPVLRNSAATVAYPGDASQSSRFYGRHITISSAATAAGWNVPDSNVASAGSSYRLEVSDKTRQARNDFMFASRFDNALSFDFLDCLPDIRNLAFIHNIAQVREAPAQVPPTSTTAPVPTFGDWDATPGDAAGWYYPPASADARARPATVTIPPVNSEGFPHPDVTAEDTLPEEKYWQVYYHSRIGTLAPPQGVAAVRIVPDVTAFNADGRQHASRLAEARRVCGINSATVPSYQGLPGHNMGLLPYHSSATDGGQPLVIWTDHRADWCGRTNADGDPDCPVWEPCDINSDVAAIPPEKNRCYDPNMEHIVEVETRAGSVRDSSAPGTFSQWNWPDPRFPDHADGKHIRLQDHEMVFANIRVQPGFCYLHPAMREAFTDPDPNRRPWVPAITAPEQPLKCNIGTDYETEYSHHPSFRCGEPDTSYPSGVWVCFSMAMAGEGADEFEWIATRRIRLGVQYRLPDWGNVMVSTMERAEDRNRGAVVYPVTGRVVMRQLYPY